MTTLALNIYLLNFPFVDMLQSYHAKLCDTHLCYYCRRTASNLNYSSTASSLYIIFYYRNRKLSKKTIDYGSLPILSWKQYLILYHLNGKVI